MIVIGLTGSIAMGKSEVARVFADAGLAIFDADNQVHELYDSHFGAELLRPFVPDAIVGERVDRQKLTQIALADRQKLERVEKIVHAEIARQRLAFIEEQEKAGHAIVVVDIPLLFEKSSEKEVDVTVVVSAPLEQQKQRALARPSMTPEKLDMILARQMPDSLKRLRADYIIENDGSLAVLKQRTLAVLAAIKKEHCL